MEAKLRREINLYELTVSGVGLILGAGIYAIIGEAAGLAGNSLWMSFLIGAAISSFTGLSYAELSTVIPRSAAEYSYVKEVLDSPLASFLVGWITIMTGIVASSTVALSFAGYLRGILDTPQVPVALALVLLLSILNYVGIEESTRVNLLFTSIEALGLLFVIFLGLNRYGNVDYLELTNGLAGVLKGSMLIFFAYIGFEDIANLAEEAENPERDLPRALIMSVIITAIIYLFVALSVVGLADWRELALSSSPLALAASKAMGNSAYLMLSIIALFATSNTVLVLQIVNSRMVYGMARDGRLPAAFKGISDRGTPLRAILAVLIVSAAFISIGNLKFVAEVTNFGTFITFAAVNISAIWLRRTRLESKMSFRTPLQVDGIPLIPLLGLISCGILLTQLTFRVLILGGLIVLIGVFFHLLLS